MSATIYLLTLCLPLGTVLLIFGMKYLASVQQAKARLASDDAYRELAAQSTAAQAATAERLSAIAEALADLRSRQAAVEKMLKEVE